MTSQPFPAALRAATNGLTVRQTARLLSVAPSTVTRWLAGTQTPQRAVRADVLNRLSEHQTQNTSK